MYCMLKKDNPKLAAEEFITNTVYAEMDKVRSTEQAAAMLCGSFFCSEPTITIQRKNILQPDTLNFRTRMGR